MEILVALHVLTVVELIMHEARRTSSSTGAAITRMTGQARTSARQFQEARAASVQFSITMSSKTMQALKKSASFVVTALDSTVRLG